MSSAASLASSARSERLTVASGGGYTASSCTSSCATMSTQKSGASYGSLHTATTTASTSRRLSIPARSESERSLSNQASYQRHILSLTNRIRAEHSADAVVLNAQLSAAARLHNHDVARKLGELSHVSSDGRTLTERLLEQGYDFRYASENLARGQRDCKWVMNSWMKSPGHRRNVVNPRVKEMGLHVAMWNGRMYWCQVFGVRRVN